jgi:ABC-type phosphate/phosphonate transport system permease subunit
MSAMEQTQARLGVSWPRITLVRVSVAAIIVLVVGSWVFVLGEDRVQSHPFFSLETFSRGWGFLKELLGIGTAGTPAFLKWEEWRMAAGLAYDTLVMSVLAIGLAAAGALATFMFAARSVMLDDLAPQGRWAWRTVFILVRGLYTLSRAIPELLWAMLIIFVLAPGILPGAIALAIHNWGILGKLSAEVVEGMDTRPLRALRSAGAGRLQMLAYGVLPQALPRFLTYMLYRWEVIIRTSIIVGFVAAGGLGTEFRLSMSHFHYTTVMLLLVWYLLLVVGVDIATSALRRLAR